MGEALRGEMEAPKSYFAPVGVDGGFGGHCE